MADEHKDQIRIVQETVAGKEKLVNNGFVRVHQSFMVRMADISTISRTSIKCGKIEVPVSRRYYGELRKILE